MGTVGPRGWAWALATALALALAAPAPVAAQDAQGQLSGVLDRAARAHVANPAVPGVSVSVVHQGRILLQGGYGLVDLEWDVPTPSDGGASYEIGSVTKQFTAAAALLLAEEGRLDLDADITEYVDFDTRGHAVPVRRLLDHTSGIKGYTEMEVFGELALQPLPRDTLLRLVEAVPFEFEPGTAQIYNNSAYFLVGLAIEEASGVGYEEFVEERLFRPAGMDDSYYCSESAVVEERAHGYDATGPDALIRARYLDHRWPYAAGSLCSTVADLAAWNRALHGGEILSEASYAEMTTPAPLLDGTPIRYAMGVAVDERGGHREISHGGGINGFLSHLMYFPDDDLSVVVLQNSTGPPGAVALAVALAEAVLGPFDDPDPVAFRGDPEALAGTYRGPARGRTLELAVSMEDGVLTLTDTGREGAEPVTPAHRGGLRWDDGRVRYLFRTEGGEITELRVDSGGGHYVLRRVEG